MDSSYNRSPRPVGRGLVDQSIFFGGVVILAVLCWPELDIFRIRRLVRSGGTVDGRPNPPKYIRSWRRLVSFDYSTDNGVVQPPHTTVCPGPSSPVTRPFVAYPAGNQTPRPNTSARTATAAIATQHIRMVAQSCMSPRFDGSSCSGRVISTPFPKMLLKL